MSWGKLAGLFSLKAILLALLLSPVTVAATGITAAQAQQFDFGGFRINIYGHNFGGRRYSRGTRHTRQARRSRNRGGQQQEVSGSSSPAASSSSLSGSAPTEYLRGQTPSASRGYRPSTD
jgi:hypothetical protein